MRRNAAAQAGFSSVRARSSCTGGRWSNRRSESKGWSSARANAARTSGEGLRNPRSRSATKATDFNPVAWASARMDIWRVLRSSRMRLPRADEGWAIATLIYATKRTCNWFDNRRQCEDAYIASTANRNFFTVWISWEQSGDSPSPQGNSDRYASMRTSIRKISLRVESRRLRNRLLTFAPRCLAETLGRENAVLPCSR